MLKASHLYYVLECFGIIVSTKNMAYFLIVSNFALYWIAVFIEKGVKTARILLFTSYILSRHLLQIITGSGFKTKSNKY